MNPNAHNSPPPGADAPELHAGNTVSMQLGPGYVMRQCTDVSMEDMVADALIGMMQEQTTQYHQQKLQSNIEQVATELVISSRIVGTTSHAIRHNATTNVQWLCNDLQPWAQLKRSTAKTVAQELHCVPTRQFKISQHQPCIT